MALFIRERGNRKAGDAQEKAGVTGQSIYSRDGFGPSLIF